MLNYAICEISGKQYKVIPNTPFKVARQEGDKDIVAKVLLLSEDGKISVGKPYLKEELTLKRVEDLKGPKIRVSKFHAKANFRKTTGYRSKLTKVIYSPLSKIAHSQFSQAISRQRKGAAPIGT